jgi:hypothetical protein
METKNMNITRRIAVASTLLLSMGVHLSAHAVPSYSRQTGDACTACHVGAFGPQLTPHGIAFKLGGYTDNNGSKSLPLSAMLTATFTNTQKAQADAPTHYNKNNNATPQELSVFVAGRLSDHIGAFSQITYNAVERKTALDRLDVRYATESHVMGADQPALIGLSLNNSPTLQDPFNTLPVFAFPYIGTDLAPTPDASTLLQSGLDGQLLGLTAYLLQPNGIYAEAGVYTDQSRQFLDKIQNIQPEVQSRGFSPYGRLAYYHAQRQASYSVGLVAMQSQVRPLDAANGDHYDKMTDVGIDAHYMMLGNRKHVCTAAASYIYEKQSRQGSYAAGEAEYTHGSLKSSNVSSSYFFDQTYGLTLGAFDTQGSQDALVYGDNTNHRPDSRGYMVETSWTPWGKDTSWLAPWANVRVGLQYTGYTRFNGLKQNYDGTGRNASDNNTALAYLWTSW